MLNNWIWIEYDWFPSHFLILIYNNLLTCAIGLNFAKN